ncbi:MAG: hypothetical protein A2086_06875 [Spirochaetes bacterium GWD1_27_9]|nr:MAG: hypothetical protein A2Z98_18665 [Spirochaetes bacterium GWB1_27_13]OHD20244.1 MAG: hypothetical protein A2Y34_04905 [Spirochaetes bacterium GWC1_27_15]OHD42618.1 MAG: hypothetical protein A2086_06875 [Spirochaetes bacterium GWD1_27_9]
MSENFNSLENILKKKFHGAVNIRGIKFQLLFSIFKSFELLKENPNFKIQLEGIEDLDVKKQIENVNLKGLKFKNIYIQAKTSDNLWNWTKYQEVFKNFYEIYKIDNQSNFEMITNFEHNKDWLKIINKEKLDKKEEIKLNKRFKAICDKIGLRDSEKDDFFTKIKLKSYEESKLIDSIVKNIIDLYSLANDIVYYYLDILFGKFLEKSKNRDFIDKLFLDNLWVEFNQLKVRNEQFDAYKNGLISKLVWNDDNNKDDFYDGKKVRPSQIVSNLDVFRQKWIEQINKAIYENGICVIKSSSGQGKSTLLYRYVYNYWSEKYIYTINSVKTAEEVELINDFLRMLKKLDYPIIVVIDNVDNNTRYWYKIASLCREIGIKLLISVRYEDWFRFSDINITNYETIQPYLDIEEAKEIYNNLKKINRIHKDIVSPQWAFEKLEDSKLLIEYIYLITHGEMLKEKLNEQIKNISILEEDKAKIEILRKVSVADMLGSPLSIKKLQKNINSKSDLQYLLESLEKEYIDIKEGIITGIHWVRSKHISQILHGKYKNLTDTAIEILNDINFENLDIFVSNCISNKDINNQEIFKHMQCNIQNYSLKDLKKIFRGLFIGGEKLFYLENKANFDEAFDFLGDTGIFFLGTSTLPTKSHNAIESLKKDGLFNESLENLERITQKIKKLNRGFDLCNNFFDNNLNKNILQEKLKEDILNDFPEIFHWLKYSNMSVDIKNVLLKYKVSDFDNIDIENLKYFLSGIYEYDNNVYLEWFEKNRMDLMYFLTWQTNSLNLDITEEKEIKIKYISIIDNETGKYNDKSVKRIKILREILPFLKIYSTERLDFEILGITPTYDKGYKNIPIENEPLQFIIEINKLWAEIVENNYRTDSYYIFQQKWFELRNCIIKVMENFNKWLKNIFMGKSNKVELLKEIDNINIIKKMDEILGLPLQIDKNIEKQFKDSISDCDSYFRFFVSKIGSYSPSNDNNLLLHNLNEYRKNLDNLYKGFKLLFDNNIPDYFKICDLKEKEKKEADRLVDMVGIFINHWKSRPILSFEEIIKQEKEIFNNKIVQSVKNALKDKKVFVNNKLYINHPLNYLFIAFEIENPLFYLKELLNILKLLNNIENTAHCYYLMPIYQGNRIINGIFQFYDTTIRKINNNEYFPWESFLPVEIDDKIKLYIQDYPYKEVFELSFIDEFKGFFGYINMFYEILRLTTLNDKESYYLTKFKQKIIDYYNSFVNELINKANDFYNKYKLIINQLQKYLKDVDIDVEKIIYILKEISVAKDDSIMDIISKNSEYLIKCNFEITKYTFI